MFGKLLCALTQKHKWESSTDDIPEGVVFRRIDCLRCGYSVDGVKCREVKRILIAKGGHFAAVAARLP